MENKKIEQIETAINEQLLYNQLFTGKITMQEYIQYLELFPAPVQSAGNEFARV